MWFCMQHYAAIVIACLVMWRLCEMGITLGDDAKMEDGGFGHKSIGSGEGR